MADRREECAGGADGHRHEKRVGPRAQLRGGADGDGTHHGRGRRVVHEIRERHGHDQDHRQAQHGLTPRHVFQ